MDQYDLHILRTLHSNARITMKELSERIHLSQPSCAERVKKLEAKGIIKGYQAQIDWELLDYPIAAVVRITPLPGKLNQVEAIIRTMKSVEWCEKLTGDFSFLIKIHLNSVRQLDDSLFEILQIATTSTSVIKYTVVDNRFIAKEMD